MNEYTKRRHEVTTSGGKSTDADRRRIFLLSLFGRGMTQAGLRIAELSDAVALTETANELGMQTHLEAFEVSSRVWHDLGQEPAESRRVEAGDQALIYHLSLTRGRSAIVSTPLAAVAG